MTNYHLGDFLIRVKNAGRGSIKSFSITHTNLCQQAADALKRLGFLDEVKVEGKKMTVTLRFRNKASVITDLKLISKPGLRIYYDVDDLSAYKGPSYFIISTPKGVLTNKEAIKQNVGGEMIAEIY